MVKQCFIIRLNNCITLVHWRLLCCLASSRKQQQVRNLHTVIDSFKQYNCLSTRNSERPSKVIICLSSSKNFDRRKNMRYSTCRIEAVTCCSSVVSVSGESNIFESSSIGLSLDCFKYGGISLCDICFPFDKITSNR